MARNTFEMRPEYVLASGLLLAATGFAGIFAQSTFQGTVWASLVLSLTPSEEKRLAAMHYLGSASPVLLWLAGSLMVALVSAAILFVGTRVARRRAVRREFCRWRRTMNEFRDGCFRNWPKERTTTARRRLSRQTAL
jgi:hypothetical protein